MIATDVLEHIEKDRARLALDRWLKMGSHLVIGVPLLDGWLRGGFEDNPHEAHISVWQPVDFVDLPLRHAEVTFTEDSLLYGLYHFQTDVLDSPP